MQADEIVGIEKIKLNSQGLTIKMTFFEKGTTEIKVKAETSTPIKT